MKCKDCKVWGCQHRTSNAEQECVLQNSAAHIIPSDGAKGFLVQEGTVITVDWSAFRREAAKVAMEGILASGDDGWSFTLAEGYKPADKHSYPVGIARFAIACADELINQLKEDQA